MIEVRPLQSNDLAQVVDIDVFEAGTQWYKNIDGHLQIFEKEWQRPTWDAEYWPAKLAQWAQKLKPDLHLGAFIGARMVGIAGLRYRLTPEMAQLTSLYIDRHHRKQGVASQLVHEVFRLGQGSGAQSIYVSSKPSIPAVGFYTRHGFRLTAEPHPEMFALEPQDIHMVKPFS
ncbi:MAG: GNAT family N-acetyltransferase [Caldilineaceae bacterium]